MNDTDDKKVLLFGCLWAVGGLLVLFVLFFCVFLLIL